MKTPDAFRPYFIKRICIVARIVAVILLADMLKYSYAFITYRPDIDPDYFPYRQMYDHAFTSNKYIAAYSAYILLYVTMETVYFVILWRCGRRLSTGAAN